MVQQRAGRVKPDAQQGKGGMNINSDKSLENEADTMGAKAAQGKDASMVSGKGSGVQRKDDEKLNITKGELTTLGEGTSQYIHWPKTTSSGVTIGRGYDIGSRTKDDVKADLAAAGMDESQANKIAEGAGPKGSSAGTFVTNNVSDIGQIENSILITLLANVFDTYTDSAESIATSVKSTMK